MNGVRKKPNVRKQISRTLNRNISHKLFQNITRLAFHPFRNLRFFSGLHFEHRIALTKQNYFGTCYSFENTGAAPREGGSAARMHGACLSEQSTHEIGNHREEFLAKVDERLIFRRLEGFGVVTVCASPK